MHIVRGSFQHLQLLILQEVAVYFTVLASQSGRPCLALYEDLTKNPTLIAIYDCRDLRYLPSRPININSSVVLYGHLAVFEPTSVHRTVPCGM